jgi:hypothetical protein
MRIEPEVMQDGVQQRGNLSIAESNGADGGKNNVDSGWVGLAVLHKVEFGGDLND